MKFYQIMNSYDVPYPVGTDMETTRKIINEMVTQFKNIYPKPTKICLLMRESSGAIMAALFAAKLTKYMIRLIAVRKPHENSHCGIESQYIPSDYKIVIIDDFMSSGDTLNAIHKAYEDKEIDTLIISGNANMNQLNFEPNNLIARHFTGRDSDDSSINTIQGV